VSPGARDVVSSSARGVLLYVGAWTLVVLFLTSQSVMVYATTGGEVRVAPVLKIHAISAGTWALLGPVVLFVARRWALDGPRWPRALLVHLATLVALWFVAQGMITGLRSVVGPPAPQGFARQLAGSINLAVVVYGTLALAVHVRRFQRRLREKEVRAAETEGRLTRARLDALRAQLHPHFLFNTMHAISALVRDAPRAAEDMLAELAELLRFTVDGAQGDEVPLATELEFIERYLAIQRARFGDRLEVVVDVESGARRLRVPSLLLQPFVENAIEHGIGRARGGGRIAISARRVKRRLRLSIRNDGPGVEPATLRPDAWGTGLSNTRERLEVHYGSDHEMRVEANPEGGVTATLDLPARLEPQEGS